MPARKSDYPISPLILNRWSPRSMSGETLSDEELMPLFEAARWAPSSSNKQPWRFLYGKQGTEGWQKLFSLLVPSNQAWCARGAALALILSDKSSATHSFDTGMACQNLALEGSAQGLVVHFMEGFDYKRAREVFELPDSIHIEAMLVVGKKEAKDKLPPHLQKREEPSSRKPLAEFVMNGSFRMT